MTPEYTIVGLLVAGMSAVFLLYQRGVAASLSAKDAEIAWLRGQLEPWTQIARTAVTTTERLTKADVKP